MLPPVSSFLCHLLCRDSNVFDEGWCFWWQARDEMWKQEGPGLSTSPFSLCQGITFALWKAGDGASAAFFLLFTKCPEVCSLSDHFWSTKWKQDERTGKKIFIMQESEIISPNQLLMRVSFKYTYERCSLFPHYLCASKTPQTAGCCHIV